MSDSEKPKSSWRERRQSIKHKWLAPLVFPEWLCERVSYFLGKWAFLDILRYAGQLTIILAVISYFMEADERRTEAENQRKAKHYQAWQVINAAQGKPGSGGRMDALQDLHRDEISLAGVDISMAHLPRLKLDYSDLRRANLAGADLSDANLTGAKLFRANLVGAVLEDVNLPEASLYQANLAEANLMRANLTGVDLRRAKLDGAKLIHAKLAGARLEDANLPGASLSWANLTGACLYRANFSKAYLMDANLTEAKLEDVTLPGANLWRANLAGVGLYRANLSEANLMDANLTGANLTKANLKDIKNWQKIKSIKSANIYEVEHPPVGFIEWAKEHGAVIMGYDEFEKFLQEKLKKK